MKRECTLLAVAFLASSTAAYAQARLFGVMDLSVRSIRNSSGESLVSLTSGGNLTSRLGYLATEDLGGGLQAGAHLESTVFADTGMVGQTVPANQFFDRRSTVGLSQDGVGELRLGRDFVPTYIGWGRFDPFGYVGLASSGNLISALPNGPIKLAFGSAPNTLARSSNGVQYLLPAGTGGWEGGVMLAPREGGTAAQGQAEYYGGRVGYVIGGFNASAAYATTHNDLTKIDRFSDAALGASYDFRIVKASIAWRRFDYAQAHQTNILVGLWVPFGPHLVRASFQRAEIKGAAANVLLNGSSADQWSVGYVYQMSKRTALYATAAQISNQGLGAFALPNGVAARAGGRLWGTEAGVSHVF